MYADGGGVRDADGRDRVAVLLQRPAHLEDGDVVPVHDVLEERVLVDDFHLDEVVLLLVDDAVVVHLAQAEAYPQVLRRLAACAVGGR